MVGSYLQDSIAFIVGVRRLSGNVPKFAQEKGQKATPPYSQSFLRENH